MAQSITTMIHNAKHRDENKINEYCHKCLTLLTPREEYLRPFKVHKLMIPILDFNSESRLMKVSNHLVEKPWRVLTQYIFIRNYSSIDGAN